MKLHLEQEGLHETTLREQFSSFEFQGELPPITDPICIILFTNRSGSTLVSDYLRATGEFVGLGEPLNHTFACELAQKLGIETFPEYMAHNYHKFKEPGKSYGMKAGFDQAMLLVRAGIIPGLFTRVRWVLVQRHDLLSQAISFTIADQTKQWHSYDDAQAPQPQYDFDKILRRVHSLSLANVSLQNFFALLDIQPYRLDYEKFAANPVMGTMALARFLGKPGASVDPARLQLSKQRDETNEEFRQRFLGDYRRRLGIGEVPG